MQPKQGKTSKTRKQPTLHIHKQPAGRNYSKSSAGGFTAQGRTAEDSGAANPHRISKIRIRFDCPLQLLVLLLVLILGMCLWLKSASWKCSWNKKICSAPGVNNGRKTTKVGIEFKCHIWWRRINLSFAVVWCQRCVEAQILDINPSEDRPYQDHMIS